MITDVINTNDFFFPNTVEIGLKVRKWASNVTYVRCVARYQPANLMLIPTLTMKEMGIQAVNHQARGVHQNGFCQSC